MNEMTVSELVDRFSEQLELRWISGRRDGFDRGRPAIARCIESRCANCHDFLGVR